MARQEDGISQLTELMSRNDPEPLYSPEPIDPKLRRRRRIRAAVIAGVIVVALVGGAGGYSAWALNAPIAAAAASTRLPNVAPGAPANIGIAPEGESAVSVSGADDYLGPTASGVWMTGGGDAAVPIASITKLITVMVILSAKPLSSADDPGPTITFSKADHALYDKYYVQNATIAAMPTGSSLSEHDALETMLVASACNYAEAMAGWAFGSQSAFLSATRAWLAANGMNSTTIVEPTGIDARNTSTPGDMMILGKLAMANPAVTQIAAMQVLDVPGVPPVGNTNDLLGAGIVTGLKTGTLDGIGSMLLFSANLDIGAREPLSVLGVVLGGYSHESVNLDVNALLTSIAQGFHDVPVATGGDQVGTYSTPWGESAHMVLGQDASIFTWSDTPITATMQTTTITTGKKGERVGTVTYAAGPRTITVPIVLDGTIAPPDDWWRLTHPSELGN